MKKINSETIEKIIQLRKHGFSVPEIGDKLNIPKTTVFRYIKSVEILPEFKKEWAIKRGGSRKRKLLKEKIAFESGKKFVEELNIKEKGLFLSALYWAEGSKKDFSLSNTDPDLIKTFIIGLREVFGVKDDEFRVSVRIYEDLDKDKCLDYWSKVVNIPKEKFINVNVLPGKKKGKLEYGMCRIRIAKGGDLLKKIKGINAAIICKFALVA